MVTVPTSAPRMPRKARLCGLELSFQHVLHPQLTLTAITRFNSLQWMKERQMYNVHYNQAASLDLCLVTSSCPLNA